MNTSIGGQLFRVPADLVDQLEDGDVICVTSVSVGRELSKEIIRAGKKVGIRVIGEVKVGHSALKWLTCHVDVGLLELTDSFQKLEE